MNETITSLLKLYKDGKITEYVLEKEFAKYIGDKVGVKILVDSTNTNTSYVAFVIPEKHVEGLYLNIIFDRKALFNLYDENEIIAILDKLKEKKFAFIKKYYDFITEKAGQEITFSEAMGFLLNLYAFYRGDLAFKNTEFLPSEDEILKVADKFNVGQGTQEDTENLLVKHYISYPIIAFVEKYVTESSKIYLSSNTPTVDALNDEIGAFCKDQWAVPFGHVEIPYNHKPLN